MGEETDYTVHLTLSEKQCEKTVTDIQPTTNLHPTWYLVAFIWALTFTQFLMTVPQYYKLQHCSGV